MLTLYGVAVTAENARHLVATLIADGEPHALTAAAMIQRCLDQELFAVALESEERDAILTVLNNPPADLKELHDALARDHRNRMWPD